jgi:hypothetical protein
MVALEALDLGEDPSLLFGQLYVLGHSSSSRAAQLLWGESSPPPARLERGKRPDQCVDACALTRMSVTGRMWSAGGS